MGLIEEVTRMQQQGMSNQDISLALQQQGVDKRKISEVLSQTAIKNAVSSTEESPSTISEYSHDSGMEQSVMNNSYSDQNNQKNEDSGQESSSYVDYSQFSNPSNQQQYSQAQQNYPQEQYQQYDTSSQGSDNMSEIAEQIFDEKISALSKKVESILDFKMESETKIESLAKRLERLEKIIDRLQLSVLQKVGEYITNVEDIKKEISETQKSFKYLLKDKPSI